MLSNFEDGWWLVGEPPELHLFLSVYGNPPDSCRRRVYGFLKCRGCGCKGRLSKMTHDVATNVDTSRQEVTSQPDPITEPSPSHLPSLIKHQTTPIHHDRKTLCGNANPPTSPSQLKNTLQPQENEHSKPRIAQFDFACTKTTNKTLRPDQISIVRHPPTAHLAYPIHPIPSINPPTATAGPHSSLPAVELISSRNGPSTPTGQPKPRPSARSDSASTNSSNLCDRAIRRRRLQERAPWRRQRRRGAVVMGTRRVRRCRLMLIRRRRDMRARLGQRVNMRRAMCFGVGRGIGFREWWGGVRQAGMGVEDFRWVGRERKTAHMHKWALLGHGIRVPTVCDLQYHARVCPRNQSRR